MMNLSKTTIFALCFVGFALTSMSFTYSPKTTAMEFKISSTNAFFTASDGVASETPAAFQNRSSNASSYLWEFGDGTISTDANPQHTYQNAGTYSVKLTAFGAESVSEFIGTVDVISD